MSRFRSAWAAAAVAGLALTAGCSNGGPAHAPAAAASARPAGSASAGSGAAASAAPAASPSGAAPPGAAPSGAASSGGAPSPGSAAAVLAAALATLKAGAAVHVAISTTLANGTITFSDDATADGGRQSITLSTGGAVSIIYVGGVGYVRGDAQGLAGFMQVPAAQAQALAGQWIAVRPGQAVGTNSYADIVAGITLSSVASEITPAAPLSLTGPVTVAGQRAIGVLGTAPASAQQPASARVALDVAASGSRPLRETVVASGGYSSVTTFSDWGESLSLAAPAHTVAPVSSPPALD